MPTSVGTIDIYKVSLGDLLVYSKISIGNDVVYTAGNTVTYFVDSNLVYQEEVDADETVLSPKDFIPVKAGWEFVGWRLDTTASEDVLSNLIMGDEPITLYAVFRQTVTLTYYNGNTTKQTATGYKYYNNGNTVNPVFTIVQATLSGWNARGWSQYTTGNGAIAYNSLSGTGISDSITLYAMYQQNITLSYAANGGIGAIESQSGIRYYNPGSGAVVDPTFTVKANSFTRTTYTFARWRLNSTSGTAYSPGNTVILSASATLYAEWTYVGNPVSYNITNLTWSVVTSRNLERIEISTAAQNNAYDEISAIRANDEDNVTATVISNSIPTNGNRTLTLQLRGMSNPPRYATVAGVRKSMPAGSQEISFDISTVSSVNVQLELSSEGWQNAHIFLIGIKLT